MSREWAMPNKNTFIIPPIGEFVNRYCATAKRSIDPFARDGKYATLTNDLNPKTSAQFHLEAVEFLNLMFSRNENCDLALLDPPYSPRQVSECYSEVGLKATMQDTQSSFYTKFRNALMPCLSNDATVLSFGWNSVGMGKSRGFELIEMLIVCHGGAHNDTICIAEKRIAAVPSRRAWVAGTTLDCATSEQGDQQ